jgi:steroid 5-alpha reductase family enzyme
MDQSVRDRRWFGVMASVVTYAVALAAALAAGYAVSGALDADPLIHALVVVAVADLTATTVVFGASVLADNSSMYDPYWSLKPLAIAVYYVWLRAAGDPAAASGPGTDTAVGAREILVVIVVALYSIRLTSNFLRDWPGLSKEDFRYVGFRRRFGRWYWPVSFLAVHLFPTIMVYLGCLPLYGAIVDGGSPFGGLDVLAAIVTLGAILLAFVADEQLRRFRREQANAGRTIRSGLWSLSRHPNYLGEVATWWGVFLFALAAGWGWWWTGVGAVAITALFLGVSIPMMERYALARRPDYAAYQASVSRFLPFGARDDGAVGGGAAEEWPAEDPPAPG